MAVEGGCAIAVMAKAPRAGAVKTRLVPPLTFEGAANLSRGFLFDITENIRLASLAVPISGYVAYAPRGVESLFDDVLAPGTRLIRAEGDQVEDPQILGFGRCLFQVIRDLLDLGHSAAIVLNSDSPTLPTHLLEQAAATLLKRSAPIVMGPADDGGYYLLGMTQAHAELFRDISWSTDIVANQTRARARDLGAEMVELDSWYDVDDHTGLDKLLGYFNAPEAAHNASHYPAPATADCLERLGLLEGHTALARSQK